MAQGSDVKLGQLTRYIFTAPNWKRSLILIVLLGLIIDGARWAISPAIAIAITLFLLLYRIRNGFPFTTIIHCVHRFMSPLFRWFGWLCCCASSPFICWFIVSTGNSATFFWFFGNARVF